MSDITIRRAGPDDAPAVAHLARALLATLLPPEKVLTEAVALQAAGRLLSAGQIAAWLAEEGGRPVGLLTITEMFAIFARGAFGEITELYVDPTLRSQRLGERLVGVAREHATAQGWSRLELSAPLPESPGAERAWAFYRRLGFKDVGPRFMLPV